MATKREAQQANQNEGPPRLRFQFVGMLFALAIAEVAVKWAQVVLDLGLNFSTWPAHLHLLVALCLIATSWLGWSWSAAKGNQTAVEDPFSVGFLVLLVDVVLVILYFMVARSVELIQDAYPVPSARQEFYLVSAIFALYLLWDFLTKALFESAEDQKPLLAFWSRGKVSLACLALVGIGSAALKEVEGVASVCSADLGLLSLIFMFRAWKRKLYAWTWSCLVGYLVFCGIAYACG